MNHNYAPVVIFGYNRVDKLRKCIEALMECDGIGHTEIFLYIDGPKDQIDEYAVNKVKEYTRKLKEQSRFLNMKIKYQAAKSAPDSSSPPYAVLQKTSKSA